MPETTVLLLANALFASWRPASNEKQQVIASTTAITRTGS